jgi:hypothetical protein
MVNLQNSWGEEVRVEITWRSVRFVLVEINCQSAQVDYFQNLGEYLGEYPAISHHQVIYCLIQPKYSFNYFIDIFYLDYPRTQTVPLKFRDQGFSLTTKGSFKQIAYKQNPIWAV